LSSKPKKPKAEKKAAGPKKKTAPVRPKGRTPEATVVSRHGTGIIIRLGRGFSNGELTSAGLEPRLASRWGLVLDPRRRSVIQGNVDSLSAWRSHGVSKTRGAGRVQKAEEEVEKIGREVEKEALKVERGVVKVAKEVKEEAVKEERAVRRRAAKPKKEE
jgi:ribosomal protein L13E